MRRASWFFRLCGVVGPGHPRHEPTRMLTCTTTPHRRKNQEARRMADYSLPDLPYDYGALEPSISGQIMELHHSKHHQEYVAGTNTALEQLAEARSTNAPVSYTHLRA